MCCRTIIGSGLTVALAVAIGWQAVAQDKPKPAGLPLDSATQQPIPQEAAPDEIKRMIEEGQVTVVYESDMEFRNAGRGWADFHWQVERTFQYQTANSVRKGQRHVKITVTKIEPVLELTHLVRLPSQLQSPRVWNTRLLRHEFDHVAITLDARPRLLLLHLLKHLPPIERTLTASESFSESMILRLINDEIDKRAGAIVELMRENNRLLDKITQHGAVAVPDRPAFFAKLYAKDHLVEQKFAFVNEAFNLLKSREYDQTESRQLPRDPTSIR